jgi:nicotinamidase-related amidase
MIKIGPNSILVLIDVQKGTSDPVWGRRNNPGSEKSMKNVLDNFRNSGLPVIHIRQEVPMSLFRKGKPTFDFKGEVRPEEGEIIITKNASNAFMGTNLEELIREYGDPMVFYAWLLIDRCVSTTVRMSEDLGFKSYLLGDCCAAYDLKDENGNTIPVEIVHTGAFSDIVYWNDIEF